MNKIYVDKVTHKPIEYTEENILAIYVKVRNGTRRLRKFYQVSEIENAFSDFYDLEIPDTHRKILCMHSPNRMLSSQGTILLSMKGYSPSPQSLSLVTKENRRISYKKVPTLNLINTPETLAIKIRSLDLSSLPLIPEKWTQSKVMYALLSWFFSLDQNGRNEVLKKAFPLYLNEKLSSGGKLTELGDNLVKVYDDHL